MTDKQIIIDGIKTSKEDFIDNFAIELTNRNIFEREQIGDKYFEIILAKEQECEELTLKCSQLKQTLAEIKPILEYYENSKIGEKQEDGSYKLEWTFSDVATPYCIKYDPEPAREALRKINEVEE